MNKRVDMLQGPLFKNISRFVVPVILTNLLQILFNTADMIIVGQYCGSIAVAAVSATTSLTHLIVNFFIGISVGTGVAVARAIGSKHDEDVHRTVHNAIPTAIICGGLISLIGVVFAPTFLRWMGTLDSVLPLSSLYMRIYFAGMIFNMVYNFSASIMRAAGETKLPLFFLTIAGVVNVGLNVFFVTVLNMNVAGVALATTISQAISAVMAVRALTRRTDNCRLILKKMRIYKNQLLTVLRLGLPAGVQSSLFAVSNVIIVSSINSFNNQALISGNGAAQSLEGLISSFTGAFHTTQVNFVGQNAGAHNFKRVRKIYTTSLCTMIVSVLSISGLVYLFREPLLSLYITDSPEAILWGIKRMGYITCLYFLLGCMDSTTGALRGLGFSLLPMFITLIGACGLRILWVYTIFQIPQYHTMDSLYLSFPISWIITFLVQFVLFLVVITKKIKAQNTLSQRSTI